MADPTPALPTHPVRLADLDGRRDRTFDLMPTPAERAAVAAALDIPKVRKLRLTGRLLPVGRKDWRLEAELGATVVQDCVVTLEPVTTRIDEAVTRSYLSEVPDLGTGEVEMPEDDEADPLPAVLDLAEVMIEALALALPPFPRAEGASLEDPDDDDDDTADVRRPFSGLKDLLDPKDE
ncbi:DUF177 domain-containing protein [Loktanella sp. IMCC34160]|uniref:YceD family protein n=1 Tax=Loktanella sp. IMCC34160 TaxID=2510646 RepID=UPI00101CD42C|nr:DUF177 domain-containing protein [Loktanella sp. IMCC34160]RYG92306.1 DUF177 domain-containing protein [Loktanella sp. IMCC34160]